MSFNRVAQKRIFVLFSIAALMLVLSPTATKAADLSHPGRSTMSLRPSAASTTTTVTSSQYSITYGQPLTFTATVTSGGGTPDGNITFKTGSPSGPNISGCVGIALDLSGQATCNGSVLNAGTYVVYAVYGGHGSFTGSNGFLSPSQTILPADTTTTITNATALGSTPTVVGQGYAVNYTVAVLPPGSGTPSGNVLVSDGTNTCTGTVAAGTCTLTSMTDGSKTITATYQGSGNFNASASTGVPHTVNTADTSVNITNSGTLATASVVGQGYAVNYQVTVDPPGSGTPTGTVLVSDGTNSCSASVGAGTCTLASMTQGSKTIVATYQGDANYNTSFSTGVTHPVNKASTTASIPSGGAATVVGESYSVGFQVAVTSPGSGTPTGNVQVSDGTNTCVGTVAAGSCTLTSTSYGTKSLTATYQGDLNYNASATSPGVSHVVNMVNTTATITNDLSPTTVVGQGYAVNYSVSVNAPGSTTLTGNVVVSDGTDNNTCPLSAGTCTLTSTTAGSKSITATYQGDANANASPPSSLVSHTVNRADTWAAVTNITALATPTVVGQGYPVTYQVFVYSPGGGTPTGTVVVSDGTDSCSASVSAGTCTLISTSAGGKSITATYQGTANYNASPASGSVSHTVSPANTTATITNAGALATATVVGQSYPVNFSVNVTAPGGSTPAGNVLVSDGTGATCTGTVAAGTCTLTSTTHGSKTVTATFQGSANHNASAASPGISHTVNKASTTASITNATDLGTSTGIGQGYAVNYQLTVNFPGSGTPTGNVMVSDGTDSNTCTVAAGTCTLVSSTPGTKSITATYQGDNNDFNASPASTPVPHVVKADTTTSITSGLTTATVVGQSYTVAYLVTVVPPGGGTPTGSVQVSDGTATCTGGLNGFGVGNCSLTSTSAGAKSVTATYLGDNHFNPSPASSPVAHTVNQANTTATVTNSSALGLSSVVGQSYVVNYQVTITSPGAGTLTGSVVVSDGTDSNACAVAAGTCTLISSTVGAKNITATYQGDSNFNASPASSPAVSHTVGKAGTTTTIVNVAALATASVVGEGYAVIYSVTVKGPGGGVPAGNVVVSDGTDSCTGTVAAGTCTLTSTGAGSKTIMATYQGNANYNASSPSAGVSHLVNKASTTITITNASDLGGLTTLGQSYQVNYQVAVNAPGNGTPTGNVTVSDGTDRCTDTVAAGKCTLVSHTDGTKSITASYEGDSNFGTGRSASVTHPVGKATVSLPLIMNKFPLAPTPTGPKPKPGLWQSDTYDEFVVNADGTQVTRFTIYVDVPPCNLTHYAISAKNVPISIVNNQFHFDDVNFHATVTFDSSSDPEIVATGSDGVVGYVFPNNCYTGTKEWPPFTAKWRSPASSALPGNPRVLGK